MTDSVVASWVETFLTLQCSVVLLRAWKHPEAASNLPQINVMLHTLGLRFNGIDWWWLTVNWF